MEGLLQQASTSFAEESAKIVPVMWKIPFHLTYGHFGNSNRKFWSNGTRPLLLSAEKSFRISAVVLTRTLTIFVGHGIMAHIPWQLSQSNSLNCIIQ